MLSIRRAADRNTIMDQGGTDANKWLNTVSSEEEVKSIVTVVAAAQAAWLTHGKEYADEMGAARYLHLAQFVQIVAYIADHIGDPTMGGVTFQIGTNERSG